MADGDSGDDGMGGMGAILGMILGVLLIGGVIFFFTGIWGKYQKKSDAPVIHYGRSV